MHVAIHSGVIDRDLVPPHDGQGDTRRDRVERGAERTDCPPNQVHDAPGVRTRRHARNRRSTGPSRASHAWTDLELTGSTTHEGETGPWSTSGSVALLCGADLVSTCDARAPRRARMCRTAISVSTRASLPCTSRFAVESSTEISRRRRTASLVHDAIVSEDGTNARIVRPIKSTVRRRSSSAKNLEITRNRATRRSSNGWRDHELT